MRFRLGSLALGVYWFLPVLVAGEVLDNRALLREDPAAIVGGVISEIQIVRTRMKYEGMSETMVRILEFPEHILVLQTDGEGVVESTLSREVYEQLWADLEQRGLWQLRASSADLFSHSSKFVVTARRGEQRAEFTAQYPPLLIPSEPLAASDQRAAMIRTIAVATGWIDRGDGLYPSPGSYTVFGGVDSGEQETRAAP
ncbi:MAG: hypothetical protein HY352_00865 [Candidatus Omnitrophica bacterium]|nr:hypothetical protein [Candidatus Omnitrophota bacterium]